ncbi:hypothetical protein [Streptomyces sp. NPDC018610]|uniref:hypothetical protein n=1 Tax=Streptomyces sp. NPDC018610 TaxID=3365049 RepID=UPI0037B3DE2B
MRIRGRQGRGLRLTAVLAATVLALTGFSRSHHGHSHGHSGGGGGCSSSSQDHDTSTSSSSGGDDSSGTGSYGSGSDDDTYDDDYGSGSTSGGSTYDRRPTHRSTPTSTSTGSGHSPDDGTARLVSCATQNVPYAVVEVTNPNSAETGFTVDVEFRDTGDEPVAHNTAEVTVPANGTAQVQVPVAGGGVKDAGLLAETDHCVVDPTALADDD